MCRKLRPIVLETNRAPSLGTDSQLDHDIKHAVLTSAFKLINLQPAERKRTMSMMRQQAQDRLFAGKTKVCTDAHTHQPYTTNIVCVC